MGSTAACRTQMGSPQARLAIPLTALLVALGGWALLPPRGARGEEAPVCAAGSGGSAAACAAEEGAEGPCTIERVHWKDLSAEQFESQFKEKRPVIIVTGLEYNARLRAAVDREALLAEYGEMVVSLGTAESYTGKRAIQVPFRRYIEEMITVPQTLDSLGNETFYLFGSNQGERFPELLAAYRLPPFEGATSAHTYTTLSFGLAGQNTGVPFHGHGPGWSEVLHGRKRWFLYPKDERPPFDPVKWRYLLDLFAVRLAHPVSITIAGPVTMAVVAVGLSHSRKIVDAGRVQ